MNLVRSIIIAAVLIIGLPGWAAIPTNDARRLSTRSEFSGEGWLTILGNTINFYYLPDANLKKLEGRLRTRNVPMSREYRTLLSDKSLSTEDRVSARLEIILLRVKDILGMNPRGMSVKIKVFKNRKDLGQEYFRMFSSSTDFKSFYVHDVRGIFTSEQDFIDSIVAHELGHAVIDSYFSVPPPEQMAELMATYVDAHLDQP